MNDTQITLAGWIGGDVTLRELADGRAVATFRVACTPTRYRDGEWVKGTTSWHTVKAWNRLGRHVASSLASGDPVVVHGRLVADVWERDGKPQTSVRGRRHGGGPRPLARHHRPHPGRRRDGAREPVGEHPGRRTGGRRRRRGGAAGPGGVSRPVGVDGCDCRRGGASP